MNTDFSSDALTDGDGADLDIGHELQTRRLYLNLTQGQISDQLKISLHQVQALENNRFDLFRSPVFARGYLKRYIHVLHLDEANLLLYYDTLQESKKTVLQPVNKVKKQAHLMDPIVVLISVVLASVLVFLAFWWPMMETAESLSESDVVAELSVDKETEVDTLTLNSSDVTDVSKSDFVSETDQTATEITQIKNTPLTSSIDKNDSDIVTGLSSEAKALLTESGVSIDALTLDTETLSKQSKAKNSDQNVLDSETPAPAEVTFSDDIVMRFGKDCWTEVRNKAGRILFSGIKKAGETLTLSGSSSYRVVLGYAPGVKELIFKGKAFDFTSFIRKDLARFELK
ncbi:RodZ domain-containing protein [Marinomonas sp. 2405UD68-3]|uniref:RodZ domain-containing protein n=1 Tax=Marinomonas sp. 2405UD68-3 TaxID=3391835 RepID=UPI0039C992CA